MKNLEQIPFQEGMDLGETNPEISLKRKMNLVGNIENPQEFITEGSERCEAFCENHPVAMESFFKKFLQ